LLVGLVIVFGMAFENWAFPIGASTAVAQEKKTKPLTTQEINFFESRIRPVLVKACYDCHSVSAGSAEGGLLLDSREGVLRGGESGLGETWST